MTEPIYIYFFKIVMFPKCFKLKRIFFIRIAWYQKIKLLCKKFYNLKKTACGRAMEAHISFYISLTNSKWSLKKSPTNLCSFMQYGVNSYLLIKCIVFARVGKGRCITLRLFVLSVSDTGDFCLLTVLEAQQNIRRNLPKVK